MPSRNHSGHTHPGQDTAVLADSAVLPNGQGRCPVVAGTEAAVSDLLTEAGFAEHKRRLLQA
ncbi:hypothetical protein [Streptomyces tibetensis]|uniref:hypothetical protein n=1 Tax=Streptomyces tibetensis TaxID=2382123 RepID=UPI0033D01C9D